jgi:hypothetical protein
MGMIDERRRRRRRRRKKKRKENEWVTVSSLSVDSTLSDGGRRERR